MRKLFLLSAIMTAVTSFANSGTSTVRNALCVSLKSGATEFVAFTTKPVITAAEGKLTVVSATDNKQLVLAELANVEKITAVNHDFTAVKTVAADGSEITEIYNIDGTKATNIIPGRIYIIKSNNTTKKIRK